MLKFGRNSSLDIKVTHAGVTSHRILSHGEKFTMGKGIENDIICHGEMPKRHAIFESNSRGFNLNLVNGMQGEIWIDGSRLSYSDLIRHHLLPRKGNAFILPLTPEKAGYIQFGDMLIEFSPTEIKSEFVLDKSFSWWHVTSRTVFKDLLFKTALVIGIVFEIFFHSFISNYKIQKVDKIEIAKVPQRFARFITKRDEKPLPETALNGTGLATSETGKKNETSPTQQGSGGRRIKGRGGSGTGTEGENQGVLGLISGVGGASSGSSVLDFLVDQGAIKGIDQILSGGVGSLKKGKGGFGTGKGSGIGDGTGDAMDELLSFGSSGGIDDIVGTGGGIAEVGLSKKSQVIISQPEKMRGSQQALGQRNVQSTMAVVNSVMGRIQYTYNKYLKGRPDLGGKISLDITIDSDGRVSDVRIVQSTVNHPEFERDIVNIFRRLRFDPIREGAVTVNIPLVLQRIN